MDILVHQELIAFLSRSLHDISSPVTQLMLACEKFAHDDETIAKAEQWQRCLRSVNFISAELEAMRIKVSEAQRASM